MLEDRPYMRRVSPFGQRRSATVTLLLVNIAAFLLQLFLPRFLPVSVASRFDDYFALSADGLRQGYLWQLITFQFMHANWMHLFGNCLAIFVFGREVEEALGRKNFLTLYFSSGIIGGLLQALAGAVLGMHYERYYSFAAPVVGASAGAFGLTAAYALLFPDRVLLLFLIIPMRAKYLLLLSGLATIWDLIFPEHSVMGKGVADAAHLGGMLTGIVFIRYAVHWHFQWPQLNRRRQRPPVRRLVKVPSQKSAIWGRTRDVVEEDLPPEEFLSKEVDPILDKISAQGIQSLTERERKILEKARSKIGKR
jgi:membrane associated rhomboid family serine protease